MATDPKDIGELQRALNDAAGKASALWITFITFELYLTIAFGSVTHRDLFLETPIRLPVLNVELPLVGFFVIAPTVLVIFHFYVFLQLLALAAKAKDYDSLLRQTVEDSSDRQYLRQRLDPFPVLQFLSGPSLQRSGFIGLSLRAITWLTLVGFPVVILLQGQLTFLAYHQELVVWLQRVVILIDLAILWYFWDRFRSKDEPILARVPGQAWPYVGAAATFCVAIFSVWIASFPGEWLEQRLPNIHDSLFAGEVNEVSGRPRSLFSNRLVLPDQSFVDADRLDKVQVSRSFRGRDLTKAVLDGADLRKADFTGAMLNGASMDRAKLQNAEFACRQTHGNRERSANRRWPDDGCAFLQRTTFREAKLQGAILVGAQLQGADFSLSELENTNFDGAALQGARLVLAKLYGATFRYSQMQGAELKAARLLGTILVGAALQGANLEAAYVAGADLNQTSLQGAHLLGAVLQGISLERAHLWRATGDPDIRFAGLDGIDFQIKPWDFLETGYSTFAGWRDFVLNQMPADGREEAKVRFSRLDPAPDQDTTRVIGALVWTNALSAQPRDEAHRGEFAAFLVRLVCSNDSGPHVARGLLSNGRIRASGSKIFEIAERMRKGRSDQAACPGVKGFTDENWAKLEELVRDAPRQ